VWLTGRENSVLDENAPVPSGLTHPRFVATPLTTEIAALDYAAYLASPDVIRLHSDGRWPVDEFTLSDDLEQVANHQADHENHRAFTFTLLAPCQAEALGCLYLNSLREYLSRAPLPRPARRAIVTKGAPTPESVADTPATAR
jgi:hypothetical protein